MRFVKATDFNFQDRKIYFGRRTFYDKDLQRLKIVMGSGRLTDGAFFWQGLNEPPVMERHFDELEILDESLPAFIEQEAETLYPFPEGNENGVYDDLKNIREWCRSAHITCARQYMDTIERLKDVLHIDQTGLAAGLAEVNKIVEGYRWVTEGRGPYAWDDDKYKEEMGNMLDNISEAATKTLNSSGAIAHSVCCGKPGRTATMEGIGYTKKDAHDQEMEKLRAENEKMRGALEEIADKGLSVSDRATWLSMQQIAKFALK